MDIVFEKRVRIFVYYLDRVNVKCHTDVANYFIHHRIADSLISFQIELFTLIYTFILRRVSKEGEEKEEKNKVTMRVCRVSLCEENVAQVVIIMSPSMTNVIIFFKVEPIFLCHPSSFLNYFFCSVILKIFG